MDERRHCKDDLNSYTDQMIIFQTTIGEVTKAKDELEHTVNSLKEERKRNKYLRGKLNQIEQAIGKSTVESQKWIQTYSTSSGDTNWNWIHNY